MILKPQTAARRVKKGIALLDERLPGWRALVDPEILDLKYGCDCVLGQIFDEYDKGCTALGLKKNKKEATALGFQVAEDDGETQSEIDANYNTLTRAWFKAVWPDFVAEAAEPLTSNL